jgi:hypothetical protein
VEMMETNNIKQIIKEHLDEIEMNVYSYMFDNCKQDRTIAVVDFINEVGLRLPARANNAHSGWIFDVFMQRLMDKNLIEKVSTPNQRQVYKVLDMSKDD